MKKNLAILSLATFALFSLVACTKDQSTLQPKDSRETEFLAQESADAVLSGHTSQKKKSWVVQLSGANELPNPVVTTMVGEARINLYKNGPNHWYTYNILLKNIPAGRTIAAAHIHEGPSTANGPVIFQLLKLSAPTVGSLNNNFGIQGQRVYITEAQFNDLNDGIKPYYVNVHSNDFPGGVIRGQMVP